MRTILTSLAILVLACPTNAQKFGHFSSEYVLSQMPSYQDAQDEINKLSQLWLDEVKSKFVEIGRLESKLQAEKVLLTPDMLEQKENDIEILLKEAIDYQYKAFGFNGLFFLKKKELMKPELDKIVEAVERVCRKHNLDYMLDKSSQLVLIYTNPIHDYTDYVLEELGLGDPNDVIR